MSHFGYLYFKTQYKLVSVGRNSSKSFLKTIGLSHCEGLQVVLLDDPKKCLYIVHRY